MGLKYILFGLSIWGIYLIVRHFAQARTTHDATQNQVKSVDSVKCAYCGLHLPKNEAIEKRGDHYCNKEHLIAAELDKPTDNE